MLLSRKRRCDVEVQVVMAQSTQHVGASSVVALAMKAGDVLFDLTASLQLTVSGSDNDGTYTPGQAGTGGICFSGLAAKMKTSTAKGKSVTGWEVSYRAVTAQKDLFKTATASVHDGCAALTFPSTLPGSGNPPRAPGPHGKRTQK